MLARGKVRHTGAGDGELRCADKPFQASWEAYARCGIAVFRCKPKSKHPYRGSRGFKDATTDPEILAGWARSTPEANIAMPTGEVIVIDIDPREGGDESWEQLQRTHGAAGPTKTVKTRLGGRHLYFTPPPGVEIKNSAGQIAPGIDVRGVGGYVLLPPSYVRDEKGEGSYTTIDTRKAAPLPGWLVDLTRKRYDDKRRSEKLGKTDESHHKRGGYAGAVPDTGPIPAGQRNDTLTSVAGRLHNGLRSIEELTAELHRVNEERCTPPLPGSEIARIAASIYRLEPCTPKLAPAEVQEILRRVEQAMEASPDAWRIGKGICCPSPWTISTSRTPAVYSRSRGISLAIDAGLRSCPTYEILSNILALDKKTDRTTVLLKEGELTYKKGGYRGGPE